ncbi:hypothetical protein Tco_0175162 [Tanacetum coccineum]
MLERIHVQVVIRNRWLGILLELLGMLLMKDHTCLRLNKEFSSLSNLKVVLATKGFDNVNVKYMGGFWVLIEFQSLSTKENFKAHVGVGSWFDTLQQASTSFNLDGRVAWVDIEGVPLKVWIKNTFSRIISKWGELLYEAEKEDSCFHRKRVCIKTTLDEIIFESFKIIVQGKVYWVRAKEVNGWNLDFREEEDFQTDSEGGSMDEDLIGENKDLHKSKRLEVESDVEEIPETINIYDLLEKRQGNGKEDVQTEDNLKYPPGFRPKENTYVYSNSVGNESGEVNKYSKQGKEDDLDSVTRKLRETSILKEDVETSTCKGHFKKSKFQDQKVPHFK